MDRLIKLGPCLFAASIAAFGIQYLIYGRFKGGLPPVPPWTPGGSFLAYVVGAALIIASVSIATRVKARLAAFLLGMLYLSCVVFLHSLKASDIWNQGTARTRALEPLALGAVAFVLAGKLTSNHSSWDGVIDKFAKLGLILFAFSMLIFGIQHFMYAVFIANLIPSWIPAHLFWVYFTGIGFIVTAICIVIKNYARLATTWLGIMFLLWVIVLHAPRVAAHPRNGDEWSSLFVALAMGGGCFIVASWGSGRQSREKAGRIN